MKLWRLFRDFLRFSRLWHYHDGVEWTKDDAVAFNKFLKTPAGTKIRANLRHLVSVHLNSAVSESNQLQYNCGYSRGFQGCVATIESYAAISEDGDKDSPRNLDHLSP